MAGRSFRVEIVTPGPAGFGDDTGDFRSLPGSEGYFGVLAGTAPLLTELRVGEIDIIPHGQVRDGYRHKRGVCGSRRNRVIVLAAPPRPPTRLMVSRAEEARQRAEETPSPTSERDVDAAAPRPRC